MSSSRTQRSCRLGPRPGEASNLLFGRCHRHPGWASGATPCAPSCPGAGDLGCRGPGSARASLLARVLRAAAGFCLCVEGSQWTPLRGDILVAGEKAWSGHLFRHIFCHLLLFSQTRDCGIWESLKIQVARQTFLHLPALPLLRRCKNQSFSGGWVVEDQPAKQEMVARSLGWEDPLNGNPLLYSCLENPIDRGAWQATAHEVAKVRHDWATEPPPSGPLEVLKAGPSVGGAAKAVGAGASRSGGGHCPVQAPPTRRCEHSADARSSAVCSKGSVSTV